MSRAVRRSAAAGNGEGGKGQQRDLEVGEVGLADDAVRSRHVGVGGNLPGRVQAIHWRGVNARNGEA
jgi:hypothetical protein